MYKYELHAHTSECDRDAHLSARELVHLYKEAGYDGMVITDHYIERFYRLWFPEDVKGLTHEQQVTRWLRGFRTAREEGEKIGFTVLPGAEVRFDGYPNDYLLYGLHEEFFFTAPRLNELRNILPVYFYVVRWGSVMITGAFIPNGFCGNDDPAIFNGLVQYTTVTQQNNPLCTHGNEILKTAYAGRRT